MSNNEQRESNGNELTGRTIEPLPIEQITKGWYWIEEYGSCPIFPNWYEMRISQEDGRLYMNLEDEWVIVGETTHIKAICRAPSIEVCRALADKQDVIQYALREQAEEYSDCGDHERADECFELASLFGRAQLGGTESDGE